MSRVVDVFRCPTPDEIFISWVNSLSDSKIRHYFLEKKARIDRSRISPAENIDRVEKIVVGLIFFKVKVTPKYVEKTIKISNVKKVEFYDYDTMTAVPIFSSIKQIPCKTCTGTGTITCDRCNGNGKIQCKSCKGTGKTTCPDCNGRGKISIEVRVRVSKEKIEKRKISVPCPRCHGSGKIPCRDCGGLGFNSCSKCNGSGKIDCKDCDGYGHLLKYRVGPTVSGERTVRYISPKSLIKSSELKETLSFLKEIEGIKITSFDEIAEDKLIRVLGFEPENYNEFKADTKRIIEKTKSNVPKLSYNIIVYPIIKIHVKTVKNKKALIIGIGSADRHKVIQIK